MVNTLLGGKPPSFIPRKAIPSEAPKGRAFRGVTPERGDIFWVNLDPTVGTEIKKKRPAIIVSNNAANKKYHQVTVIPLTSQKVDQVEVFQVFVAAEEAGLQKDSKALAEQIRTVSKMRLGSKVGQIKPATLHKLEKAITIHLGLPD